MSDQAGMDAFDDDHLHEECGVFGVFHPGEDVANLTYFGLYSLQHRGQESAGIAVSDGREIRIRKEMGLVSQVFDQETIDGLKGNIAIGHTRYSTTGSARLLNAQPISVEHPDHRSGGDRAQRQPRQRHQAARRAHRQRVRLRDDERHRGARCADRADEGRHARAGARGSAAARRGCVLPRVPHQGLARSPHAIRSASARCVSAASATSTHLAAPAT